ncbi:MAG TPA: MMPL family transporter [Bacteroidales bacterium]|nr:MMPL family transporter [Bacteroidales bacterium]
MTGFILKNRWLIITLFSVIGIISATMIPFIHSEADLRNYVPGKMESRIATDSIEAVFGVQEIAMILFTDSMILTYDNLERIRNIESGISGLEGITRQISPFTMTTIKGEDGMMVSEKLIEKIPSDSAETAQLADKILCNNFVRDIVFSSDLKAASLTIFINEEYPENETLVRIDSIIDAWPGKAKVIKGGLPYIRQEIMNDVKTDGFILVPGALLIMLLILKISLKDWKSVLMPFSVVVITTLFSMALIPVAGWKLSLMTLLAPIILVAVANNYGIYLTARYQEISIADPRISKSEVITQLISSLNMPILFSGLTTVAGILGLLTHSVIAARQVGILAASGVMLAMVMSFLYIPALISLRKPYHQEFKNKKRDLMNLISLRIGETVKNNPGKILTISAISTLVFASGIFLLRIDTRQDVYFPKNHQVRVSTRVIDDYFGGAQTISVMVEGDIKDPEVMRGIDKLTSEMDGDASVGGVFSISQVVREMSKALYDKNEEGYDKIPDSREAIAQFFELYNLSGDPDDFSQILDFSNSKAQVMIRLPDAEDKTIRSIKHKLEGYRTAIPAKITIGGYAMVMSDFGRLLINGQVSSLIFALLTVGLLLAVVFRSVKGGIFGSIPFTASILIMFGFMGFTGIAIDPATALLSSIMIGVGVDFTIQYIYSVNSFLRKKMSYSESIVRAHGTIGRSIIINALSVMGGFAVLVLSGFTSIRFFGYLVVVSMGSCLAGALIVIPALLMWLRPEFIEKEFLK